MESQEDGTSMLIAVDLAHDHSHFYVSTPWCGILALGRCCLKWRFLFLGVGVGVLFTWYTSFSDFCYTAWGPVQLSNIGWTLQFVMVDLLLIGNGCIDYFD